MRSAAALLVLSLVAFPGYPQQKKASPAQIDHQKRMMDCKVRSGGLRPEQQKKFMDECMKGGAPSAEMKKQQERTRNCSRRAADQGLKGDERMRFMGNCMRS